MSDISKIDIAGTELDIKDATARELLNNLGGGEDDLPDVTIGDDTNPVYLNSGTLTALSSTVGSAVRPVYLNSGTLTAGYMIQGGTSSSVSVGSEETETLTITYGTAFSSPPYVVATIVCTSTSYRPITLVTKTRTASSFVAVIGNGHSASITVTVAWLAIGPVSS